MNNNFWCYDDKCINLNYVKLIRKLTEYEKSTDALNKEPSVDLYKIVLEGTLECYHYIRADHPEFLILKNYLTNNLIDKNNKSTILNNN